MLQLDLRRNSLLWLLGLTFVIGVGVEVPRMLFHRPVKFPGLVVENDAAAQALSRMADSIMQVRVAAARAPININTASTLDLEQLDGVGPVLARRIVDFREQHGPFSSVDQLDSVSGIGPKRLAAIRERCVVEE